MAFRGRYEHSLDSKDRLTVPARFRAALSDGVVLAAGIDPCLWLFPAGGYESFTERLLSGASPLSAKARELRRHFHGKASDERLDSAGRVRIPKKLAQHAGLKGPCVIVGVHDYLEIWDAERWEAVEAEAAATVQDAAEQFAGDG